MKKKDAKLDVSRRDFVKTAAIGIGAATLAGPASLGIAGAQVRNEPAPIPSRWDMAADVVVIGAGATGLPASIEAVENGASVIIIEQNFDIGGHAMGSGGGCPLGGGTSLQKKFGIEDSPDQYFEDIVNIHDFRFCDREIIRAFVNETAPTFEFLKAHGVVYPDKRPTLGQNGQFGPAGVKIPRYVGPVWTGGVSAFSVWGSNGTALVRPLEASARKLGVKIMLNHSFTSFIREHPFSGKVLGITAVTAGKTLNIQARKGVIIGTGGHSANVNLRRIFDPRLTEEYACMCEPYAFQHGDSEIAAMQIGASLWGAANQTLDRTVRLWYLESARQIGCRYLTSGNPELLKSPIFHLLKATGLPLGGAGNTTNNGPLYRAIAHEGVIHVNQVGKRFVDETAVELAWLNPALSLNGGTGNGGGPIWAVFDAETAKRRNWICEPPYVDPDGYFFSGGTLDELAGRIKNPHQKQPMPARAIVETVARYNSFVDAGRDADFGRPTPKYKIDTPPFYAGWFTPYCHDSYAGLRINAKCQVIDCFGKPIAGLYCGGESAGGFNLHGLGRCHVQGRIAAREAAHLNRDSQ